MTLSIVKLQFTLVRIHDTVSTHSAQSIHMNQSVLQITGQWPILFDAHVFMMCHLTHCLVTWQLSVDRKKRITMYVAENMFKQVGK